MTQDTILRFIITFVALGLLYLMQNAVNIKRDYRGRQVILPWVALFYVVVTTVFLTMLCSRSSERFLTVEEQSLFTGSNVLILNLLMMLGFLLLKCILCPILSVKWRSYRLMESTASRFYAFDERYREWFLQNRWSEYRSIVKAFVRCSFVLSVSVLFLSWVEGPESLLWMVSFPCGVLIVLTEVCNFLNGRTREEYVHSVFGDADDSRNVSNYYRIREVYEKLFSPAMLVSHTRCEFNARKGTAHLLTQMERSSDSAERVIARYFLTHDKSNNYDLDCIQAVSALMHGRNTIFFNPFYRDLGVYLALPLMDTLLRGKRCLVVTGRNTTSQDILSWLRDTLQEYSHLRSMWKAAPLTKEPSACEIGLLSFQQLYDVDVLMANRQHFEQTDFVLMLEPSLMVNTGQIGISILTREMAKFNDAPTYCICDRYTDGLVDTMSHLLQSEITDVVAVPVPRCIYTAMVWNADGDYIRQKLFDKQTRFLGNGMELAAAAVKNQIPKVTWCSETKVPLKDVKWIAGQYYSTICRYMNLPAQQQNLYEKVHFIPCIWASPSQKEQFIIAEDEFCNMFSMMRLFLSRGEDQAFVNVFSESYLLRDYMRCNPQMFMSNPNAIPSLVPDYAKTERNTLLKLIIRMSYQSVRESEIMEELQLVGFPEKDPYDILSKLLETYTQADHSILEVKSVVDDREQLSSRAENYYSISRADFDRYFSSSLKTAYYVVEEEQKYSKYIDAKLFGHVTQTILPGQFVVYDGKYYQVRLISAENGIVLRRSSDLYSGRKYYRQIRTYHIHSSKSCSVEYARKVMDMEHSQARYDFSVTTTGYLDLKENHNLRTAKVVTYEGDPWAESYRREYKNKNVLRIRFPETDDKIRFTLCMLMSEVFRSLFPDGWYYLAVVTKRPDNISGMLNYMVYSLDGEIEDDYIYIIEDSDIDLGLLEAVNRNLSRILEIIADFLEWHFEKMREPEHQDPVPGNPVLPEDEEKRGRFLKLAQRIRRILFRKEKEDGSDLVSPPEPEKTEPSAAEQSEEESITEEAVQEEVSFYSPEEEDTPVILMPQEEISQETGDAEESDAGGEDSSRAFEPASPAPRTESVDEKEDADLVHLDGTDIFENEGMPDDNLWLDDVFTALGITPVQNSRYQRECYLKFGFNEIDGRLRIEDVRNYLRIRGCCNSALAKARSRSSLEPSLLDIGTVNHCDFCGVPLSGVSYERLRDGRVRCNDCTSSAITTVEDFRELFYRILDMMEGFFNVSYHVAISVKMTDAKTVARGAGRVFRPTTEMSPRVVGYAQEKNGRYTILIENGSPRVTSIDTMVHELTHIWQYLTWNDKEIQRLYGDGRNRDIVYEGMATWAAVQFLYQMGETYYAQQQEQIMSQREDVYGVGFCLYREKYPFVKDQSLLKYTPFSVFPPL